jgi:phenylacetate-CoA ligase
MSEKKFWNEKMETIPLEEMQKLQMEKLKKQIKYVYENSTFYKDKYDKAGIKPEDIRTFRDFQNLPTINKDEHRQSQEESREKSGHAFGTFLCAPLDKIIGVASTTGTTGDPTFYLYTEKDMQVIDELWARAYWRTGIRPGDTVFHAFGLSMTGLGITLIRAVQSMGARPIPMGAEAGTERILRMIDFTRPSALLCTPALAEYLIERAPEIINKDVAELNIKRIVCTGAPGAGLPDVRKKIEGAYGCKLYDSAGGGWGIQYVSCDAKNYQGMHSVSDDYHIWYDLVDPDTKEPLEVKNGVIGEAVFTSIDQEASPAMRYAIGDIIQYFTEPCECGLPGNRLRILGRADDMVIVKGVNIYPAAVKNVAASFLPRTTGEVRIVLDSPGPLVNPPLKVKIEYGEGLEGEQLENLKKELGDAMHSRLKFRSEVILVPPKSLERAAGPGTKGKLIEKSYE